VTYTELADNLNRVLEERRKISSSRSGMLPARGHEEEHERLTKEAEEIRKQLRRKRYGTDE
jgi:predicted transcriptional regulator